MASLTNSYPMETPTATPPPRRGWWSRPIATIPADRSPTFKEFAAFVTPSLAGLFTFMFVIMRIFSSFIDESDCKFAIQSINVSPSAMWHVDFLVTNPNSNCKYIYYLDDETAVRLGPLNAAVLNTSYEPKSPSQIMAFSVDFVAEDIPKDVDSVQLDIKLRTLYNGFFKTYSFNDAGHIDISCHNLTRSHENVEKIQCYSSLTHI